MTTPANPSIDPANYDSLTGAFRFIFKKLLQSTDGMLPAQVVQYDRTENQVQVQPLIKMVDTNGQQIRRAQIASIPVFQIGGGGFLLNFNLKPGDLGWIKANDRDISLFQQFFTESPPNTYRIKNFADSVFFPHVMTGYTIDPEDAENAVLQSLDGTVKISFGTGIIKIAAPIVDIEATTANITATTVNIIAATNITGNLFVDGNIEATGTITPGV